MSGVEMHHCDVSVPEGDDNFVTSTPAIEGVPSIEGASDDDMPPLRTRSGRRIKPNPKYTNLASRRPVSSQKNVSASRTYHAGGNRNRKVRCDELHNQFLHSLDWKPSSIFQGTSSDTKRALLQLIENVPQGLSSPHALGAKSNSADTYTYEEAMNSPYQKEF